VSDIADYLDGIDPVVVARAARNLDKDAFMLGQISRTMLDETLAKSDEELFDERNNYRELEAQ
jgi:hypothetical protein